MSPAGEQFLRVLCLACTPTRLAVLQEALKRSRYSALSAATSDEAVAACIVPVVVAAVIDAESIRGQEWTVVKTLKAVRPMLPVAFSMNEKWYVKHFCPKASMRSCQWHRQRIYFFIPSMRW
jgi:hypothetical protein